MYTVCWISSPVIRLGNDIVVQLVEKFPSVYATHNIHCCVHRARHCVLSVPVQSNVPKPCMFNALRLKIFQVAYHCFLPLDDSFLKRSTCLHHLVLPVCTAIWRCSCHGQILVKLKERHLLCTHKIWTCNCLLYAVTSVRYKQFVLAGLDAPGPLFADEDCRVGQCKGDAMFVESIQSNGKFVFGLGTFHEDGKYCLVVRWLR